MSQRLPNLFLCALLLLVVGAAVVNAEKQLVFVQVLHRHGARTAIVPANASSICGKWQCGELTIPGRAMLTALGQWVKGKYVDSGIFPSMQDGIYDQRKLWSRSTDIDRTLQSSDSMLRGVFPNLTQFYPVIHTESFDTDIVLHTTSILAFSIPFEMHMYPGPALNNSFYTLVSASTLQTMAQEAQIEGWCGDIQQQLNYRECLLAVQDIFQSAYASGQTASMPTCAANHAQLQTARRMYNTMLFQYHPSDETMKQRGSLGWILGEKLSYNFQQAQNAHKKGETYPYIFEYSAHDTTMMPISVTLGHQELMLPQFGQALAIEMWYDTTTQKYYISTYSGEPGIQTPVSSDPATQFDPTHYAYTMNEISTWCLSSKNVPSATMGATCEYGDWANFIQSSAPASQAGPCYLSKDVIKKIDCNDIGTGGNSHCKWWRTQCPAYSCPTGHVVNQNTLKCESTSFDPIVTKTSAVIIAIAAFAAGGVVFLSLKIIIMMLCRRRQAAKDYDKVESG